MRVDPSTATRAISRLEQLGLADRATSDDDRRVVVACATEAGRRTMRRVAKLRTFGMERLLEPFDDAEREDFAEHLERFVASIDEFSSELGPGR